MVFESIVKELLNRYLGEYVENLDANQLNVGIWSGTYMARLFPAINKREKLSARCGHISNMFCLEDKRQYNRILPM